MQSKENRLKIIFILNSMTYGIGQILSDISCGLPENINQTIVLLDGKNIYPHKARMRILGPNCRKPLPVPGLRLLLNVLRFRRILRSVNPDVVLPFHHDSRVINLLAMRSLPAMHGRTILIDLGLASQFTRYLAGFRKHIYTLLVRLAQKHADRIIAIAEGVKSDIVSRYGVDDRKITVIYASVDSIEINRKAMEPVEHSWFSEEIPIIALSGRLMPEKNHADLLKAFAVVRKQKRCRLVFVGDGIERDALTRLAQDLGVAEDVLFAGFQSNPHKFVARSSVFAFPSLFEAQGLVLVEAMAVGCPIVAYDCPVGPREMLAPGTRKSKEMNDIEEAAYGLLVPPGNVEVFAQAIMRLLEDPMLRDRYARAGKERAANFNVQEMVEKYKTILLLPPDMQGSAAGNGC